MNFCHRYQQYCGYNTTLYIAYTVSTVQQCYFNTVYVINGFLPIEKMGTVELCTQVPPSKQRMPPVLPDVGS